MTSEQVKLETSSQKTDSITETVMVALYDTVREVTTITILTTTEGDTLRVDRITNRDNAQLRVKSEKLRVTSDEKTSVSDTLMVRDSVAVVTAPPAGEGGAAKRNVGAILWWIFAIICALCGLVYLIKKK